MKQKTITVVSAALGLLIFISSFLVFGGCSASVETTEPATQVTATVYRTEGTTDPLPPVPASVPASDAGAEEILVIPADDSLLEPVALRHPFTDREIRMLAQVIYRESNSLSWRGEQFGQSDRARQAAVAWCALNRLDAGTFGDTLEDVLTAPNQFAYYDDTPVTEYMLELAEDVANRWYHEKNSGEPGGRTLPPNYLYFEGDGKENYFRTNYRKPYTVWDWSLDDPYKED